MPARETRSELLFEKQHAPDVHAFRMDQAQEIHPRGHAPTRRVARVPMHPVDTGRLRLVHQGAYALPEEVVDLQAHRSVRIQPVGDDGVAVEGVGRVGRQPRRPVRDRRLGRRLDFFDRQLVVAPLEGLAARRDVMGAIGMGVKRHTEQVVGA